MLRKTENRIRSLIYEEVHQLRKRELAREKEAASLEEMYKDARALRDEARETAAAEKRREDIESALYVVQDAQLRFDLETELAELLLGKVDDGD